VTQRNAAEELASTAEELSRQAESLNQLMFFKVLDLRELHAGAHLRPGSSRSIFAREAAWTPQRRYIPRMSTAPVVLTGTDLTAEAVQRVASEGAPIELHRESLRRVAACHDRLQRWGDAGEPIYGVNTGFGELASVTVGPRHKALLQRNLILSHATGGGRPLPAQAVRATMLARLNVLLRGFSGCSTETVELLASLLNARIHPVIPERGSVGASGDLAPLAHVALALIGEGEVEWRGEGHPAAAALRSAGLRPLTLGFKGALCLVNGTSAMTGLASLAVVEAEQLLRWGVFASAALFECLSGSSGALDARGHELRGQPGQVAVAAAMRRLLRGSERVRDHRSLMAARTAPLSPDAGETTARRVNMQDAYSLRCVPQILGPAAEAMATCRRTVERELNACSDNPLVLENAGDTFHGGNFHGQYVAMACDFLNVAIAEVGVLAERQVDRLLDPRFSRGLPAFLASPSPGLFCGFAGAQYLATSTASENLDLAAPSSIKSLPSNGGNQDVVSMGLVAARKSLVLCQNVRDILQVQLAACTQASCLSPAPSFGVAVAALLERFRSAAGTYTDEAAMREHLGRIGDAMKSPSTLALLDEYLPPWSLGETLA
jgi:histidine ammonia-lyase/tyrosine ammonia-lyase